MTFELAEEGRDICFSRRGRILRAGLKDRFCGDLGEFPMDPLAVGANSSGMLMGGTGASGRWKSGWGCTKACWTYLRRINVSRADL